METAAVRFVDKWNGDCYRLKSRRDPEKNSINKEQEQEWMYIYTYTYRVSIYSWVHRHILLAEAAFVAFVLVTQIWVSFLLLLLISLLCSSLNPSQLAPLFCCYQMIYWSPFLGGNLIDYESQGVISLSLIVNHFLKKLF